MSDRSVQSIAGRVALSVGDCEMSTPTGWEWARLQDIARLESGHTPSRTHPEYWGGPIQWIGIKDAREHHGRVITSTLQTVTQAGIDNSAARLLPKGTVCLSRTASVGYVVVMGREMATSQDFVNWICSDALEPEFLKYLLLAEGEESLRSFGKGSVHTTIYFPEVEEFRVCVPGANEQRRIVAKLDALLARSKKARDHLDRVPKLLDALKRSILAAAFRGDLTADWRAAHPDVEPARTLLERIRVERRRRWEDELRAKGKDPKKAKYDDGGSADGIGPWPAAPLEAIVDASRGVPYGVVLTGEPIDDGVPTVRCGDIKGFSVKADSLKRIAPSIAAQFSRTTLRGGEVLIAVRGTTGGVAVASSALVGANISREVAMIPALDGVDARFLMFYLASPEAQALIAANIKGIAQSGINLEDLRKLPVPIPTREEQARILIALEDALAIVTSLDARLAAAHRATAALASATLASAFRGELVPQDPTDEPAAAMLARLRAEKDAAPVAKPKRRNRR